MIKIIKDINLKQYLNLSLLTPTVFILITVFCAILIMISLFVAIKGYVFCRYYLMYGGILFTIPLLLFIGKLLVKLKAPYSGIIFFITIRLSLLCLFFILGEIGYLGVSKIFDESSNVKPVNSFREAMGDPVAFRKWWRLYAREALQRQHLYMRRTPLLPVPFEYIPNSSVLTGEATLNINSYGFADREFEISKGEAYRIVAMGSSHTMGPLLKDGDKPWPWMLEYALNEVLPCGNEVEVLVAAIGGYSIHDNLYRLKAKVLPLKPDMIITYFGYNGFKFYFNDFPEISGKDTVPSPIRGSQLIAIVELNFRQWLFSIKKRFKMEQYYADNLKSNNLEFSKTYQLYKEYIRIASENSIKLVVLNFNMAVNHSSPEDVISFYEYGFLNTRSSIKANEINSRVVEDVVRGTKAFFIDVQGNLDGNYEDNFVDLVHLSEAGKEVLVGNLIPKLIPILKTEVCPESMTNDYRNSIDMTHLNQTDYELAVPLNP